MRAISQFLRELQNQIRRSSGVGQSSLQEPEAICGRWLALRRSRLKLTLEHVEQLTGIPVPLIILLEVGLATNVNLPAQSITALRKLLTTNLDDELAIEYTIRIALGLYTNKVFTTKIVITRIAPLLQAITHGDLQGDNLLIDAGALPSAWFGKMRDPERGVHRAPPNEYVIDFSRTAQFNSGKILRDYVELETKFSERPTVAKFEERSIGSFIRNLRLDTAAPKKVPLLQVFVLAVAIRKQSSPVLSDKELKNTASGIVQVIWDGTSPYLYLNIRVDAPGCIGDSQRHFTLIQDEDSPVFFFNLTPQKDGVISIVVTLYQDNDALGSTRLQVRVYRGNQDEQQKMFATSMPIKQRTPNERKDPTELSSDNEGHLQELIRTFTRRLEKLQLIYAKKGIDTEPHHLMEIEDIEELLQTLRKSVGPPFQT